MVKRSVGKGLCHADKTTCVCTSMHHGHEAHRFLLLRRRASGVKKNNDEVMKNTTAPGGKPQPHRVKRDAAQ